MGLLAVFRRFGFDLSFSYKFNINSRLVQYSKKQNLLSHPPIRIAFVIPTLDQSGAEKQLAMLACGLPAAKYELLVIALNRGGPYAEVLRSANIPIKILNKRLRFDPIAHRRLSASLDEFQPDIVHSWLFSANSHVRLLKNSRTKWKSVVSERCVDSWKSAWQLWLDRKLIPRTDALIANSNSVAEFYAKLGVPPQSLHVIHNGISLPSSFSEAEAKQQHSEWLEKWKLPEDAFIVGFAGRLAPQKKLKTLLWAAHLLKIADSRIFAIFAGEGSESGNLQELAIKYEVDSHLRFIGHQSDINHFYRQCNAFWLASQYEGQSNSLMEAMAHGLPVVVSEIPANLELVTNEKIGLTAPLGDSAMFAKQIRKLVNNAELRNNLGQQARHFIQENRSTELMIEKHDQLYQTLLK